MPSAASSCAPEAGSDHRRRGQRLFGRGRQPVDARCDGRLHRGRHAELGNIRPTEVATALAGQHPALHQLAHHLLGKERVSGGPLGDDRCDVTDRGIRTQQLSDQRCGVRITQGGKHYGLGAGHPRQRTLVLGGGR